MANSFWKRYLIGAAGGAAGVAAMGLFRKGLKAVQQQEKDGSSSGGDGEPKEHPLSLVGRQHQPGEPSTAALGRLAWRKVTGHDPEPATKKVLSDVVHWGYGMDMGTAYALVRSRQDHLDWAGGLIYGAGLWALGDELAVPMLGLAEGPKAYPKSMHAQTLGAHLVYGLTTAATVQLLERVWL